MEHIIENHLLKARISSLGAELVSLVCKEDGVEHIWQGDPAVWKYHAPILFPWCGKQVGGSFTAKGQRYGKPSQRRQLPAEHRRRSQCHKQHLHVHQHRGSRDGGGFHRLKECGKMQSQSGAAGQT